MIQSEPYELYSDDIIVSLLSTSHYLAGFEINIVGEHRVCSWCAFSG